MPFENWESLAPSLGSLAPASRPTESATPALEGGKPKCPGCGGDLVTVRAQELGGATVLTCLVCFGRWVDGRELYRLRGGGLRRLWRSLLGALLPKESPRGVPAAPAGEAESPAEPEEEAPPPGAPEESARTEPPDGSA